jgi:hypothetical protein
VALGAATLAVVMGAAAPRGGAAGAPARGAAATRPVTAANRQAAVAQFAKARELFNAEKYAEAKVENDKTLLLDPTHEDALRLRIVLQDRLANAGAATGGGGGGAAAPAGRAKLLTTQQISMIRLMEMRDTERNITGNIPRAVREDYWQNVLVKEPNADTSQAAHNSFLNPQNFHEVLRQMKESNTPRYLEQITINTDPAVMADFKTSVHTFVLENCATAACHAGDKAGDFRLINGRDNASIYTNFYLMSTYRLKNGAKVIDRDNPERSVFLQYSLPEQQATFHHPGGVEIRRRLASLQDPRYQAWVQWVQGLALPQPNYGITTPVGPTTAPAGR